LSGQPHCPVLAVKTPTTRKAFLVISKRLRHCSPALGCIHGACRPSGARKPVNNAAGPIGSDPRLPSSNHTMTNNSRPHETQTRSRRPPYGVSFFGPTPCGTGVQHLPAAPFPPYGFAVFFPGCIITRGRDLQVNRRDKKTWAGAYQTFSPPGSFFDTMGLRGAPSPWSSFPSSPRKGSLPVDSPSARKGRCSYPGVI